MPTWRRMMPMNDAPPGPPIRPKPVKVLSPPPQSPSGPPKQEPRKLSLRKPKHKSPKLIIHGVPGFGKTTIGAHTPRPLLLMSETGYDTLLSVGSVPSVAAELVESWTDLLRWLDDLAENPQGIKTIALDALGGYERMCHEHVCHREYGGNWGEKGFLGWQRGFDRAVADWLGMLARLDRLHRAGLMVLLLAHTRIKNFKNPVGPDYDRFEVALHYKTWDVTHQWADAVLFGQFFTVIDTDNKKRTRGIGGQDRVLQTEQCDAWIAKNRYKMPSELWLKGGPSMAWSTIAEHLPKEK